MEIAFTVVPVVLSIINLILIVLLHYDYKSRITKLSNITTNKIEAYADSIRAACVGTIKAVEGELDGKIKANGSMIKVNQTNIHRVDSKADCLGNSFQWASISDSEDSEPIARSWDQHFHDQQKKEVLRTDRVKEYSIETWFHPLSVGGAHFSLVKKINDKECADPLIAFSYDDAMKLHDAELRIVKTGLSHINKT